MHWGTMVGSELLVVGHPERGLDGMRCAYSDNASAFMLKWVSQTFSQIFQVSAVSLGTSVRLTKNQPSIDMFLLHHCL